MDSKIKKGIHWTLQGSEYSCDFCNHLFTLYSGDDSKCPHCYSVEIKKVPKLKEDRDDVTKEH